VIRLAVAHCVYFIVPAARGGVIKIA